MLMSTPAATNANRLLLRNNPVDREKAMSLLDESLAISTELDMRPFDGAGSVSARYFKGLKNLSWIP